MLVIQYTAKFIRMYKGLEPLLKEEIKQKILLFQDVKNHESLKIHKLQGRLKRFSAFSVNYKIRIIFEYENKNIVNLLYVGGHDGVYK